LKPNHRISDDTMSTSATTAHRSGRSGHGVDNDTYEPQVAGMRNLAGHDGYDPGDGYIQPVPQLNSAHSRGSDASDFYDKQSGSSYPRQRRRSSVAGADEYYYYQRRGGDARDRGYGDGGQRRSSHDIPRSRDYMYDKEDDSESDTDVDDYDKSSRRGRRRSDSRGRNAGGKLSRSVSRVRNKLKEALGGDEQDDGEGNSQAKKWVATLAGAVAGGFAGRKYSKEHWVPAAIGAFAGGFAAREAEKTFFRHRDEKEKEEGQAWGGRDRSRSRG
jgi:hypothetical protein